MANPLFDKLFGQHINNKDIFLRLSHGRSLSFAAFVARAGQFATLLAEMPLETGDRVAIQVEKSPDALALCAACIQRGLIFLPLNPAYTASEVAYFVKDSGAKLFVCDPKRSTEFSNPSAQLLETLGNAKTGSMPKAATTAAPSTIVVERTESDLAALLYTSGTTGRSKGAMLSQQNLLSNAETLLKTWKFDASDTLIHALPIFHTHGLFVATNIALLAGASMIFMSKFETEKVIDALPKATSMMGVPTFYTRLLSSPKFTSEVTKNMRLFISGSAPLLAETHVTFEERTGHRILERYGMTETNMNTTNPYDGERKAGTVGTALPGVEMRIVDEESGLNVDPGDIGILEVRGPNVFQGYWNMPEKTAEEFRKDGYFITGDLAQLDADAYVTIVGRSKDLIISGGFNIYPKEIEEILDNQIDVQESAVIGIPHPDLGEAVVGVIVLQGGQSADVNHVLESISGELARFKQPRKLIVTRTLPRNAMGKVQKAELRKIFADTFSTA